MLSTLIGLQFCQFITPIFLLLYQTYFIWNPWLSLHKLSGTIVTLTWGLKHFLCHRYQLGRWDSCRSARGRPRCAVSGRCKGCIHNTRTSCHRWLSGSLRHSGKPGRSYGSDEGYVVARFVVLITQHLAYNKKWQI